MQLLRGPVVVIITRLTCCQYLTIKNMTNLYLTIKNVTNLTVYLIIRVSLRHYLLHTNLEAPCTVPVWTMT
jgi:hypothetical protein